MLKLETNQEIMMSVDTLDNQSAVINFDIYDNDEDQVVKGGGYVMSRQDDEDQCFYVSVYDVDGNILSETVVPFNFKEY
jgi:uncharacterized membrane protein affecting hemolysin expression